MGFICGNNKTSWIASCPVKSMVNRVGPSFPFRLHEETGATFADLVRACLASRELLGPVRFWLTLD